VFKIDIESYKYPGCQTPVIINTYLNFREQGLYLILGDNGSGKTTFSLLLFGIIPNLIKGELKGEIYFDDKLITISTIRSTFAYLFQNPINFFTGLSIKDEISTLNAIDYLAEGLISQINLDLPVSKLSAGQQQKIALICTLYSDKSYVLLDEPFEFLDDESLKLVKQIIQNKIDKGKSIFIIDHINQNRYDFNGFNKFIFFKNGKPSSDKPNDEIIDFQLPAVNIKSSVILSVDNVFFKFSDQRRYFIEIEHLNLFTGKIIGVKGNNGSGKTTLFYILSGLLKCKKAKFSFNQILIKRKKLRRIIKLSVQNPDFQLFHSTVSNEISFALKLSDKSQEYINQSIEHAESFLPFNIYDDPSSLSFGQKKLLTIYITYLINPEIVILDEPFASLDISSINIVLKLLLEMLGKNRAILISSHNINLLNLCCHEIVELKNGKLLMQC